MQTFLFIILMTITLIGLLGLAIQVFKTSLLTIYVNAELTLVGLTTMFCVAGALFKESNGYLMTLIIITVTAVEAAIGLGLLVLYYRFFRSTKIKQMARYLRCLVFVGVPDLNQRLTAGCLEQLLKMDNLKVVPGLDSVCAQYFRLVQKTVLKEHENDIVDILLVWKGHQKTSDCKQALLDIKSKGGKIYDHDLWSTAGIRTREDLMEVIKYLLDNEAWTPWDDLFVARLREFYELLKWEHDIWIMHLTARLQDSNGESFLNTVSVSVSDKDNGKSDVPSIVEENMHISRMYTEFKSLLYEGRLADLQFSWNRIADSISTGPIQTVSGYFRFGYEYVLKTAVPLSLLQLISILITVAFYTMAERKVMGAIQRRKGPNVNGPQGVAQPIEDGLKLLSKETIVPTNADKLLFFIAPAISFVLAFSAWAFVPFQEISGFSDFHTTLLFLFALSSLGVYGVIVGGWASNSKYAFLGALRSTAQMISYEIILGLIFLTLAFLCGSLSLYDILSAQKIIWFCVPLWPFLFLFVIAMLAETNRAPFDLPEAEAEIVAGYNIEYAGIVFALFFLAEYSNMLLFSALFIILFFGGAAPYVGLAGVLFFVLKLLIVAVLFIVIRAALPRLRYDQLMVKSWTVLMPLAFIIFLFVVVIVTMCVFPFFTLKPAFLVTLESNSSALVASTTQQVDLLLQLDKYSSGVFKIIDGICVFWDTFFIPGENPEIDSLFFFYILENLTKTGVILFFSDILQNDIFGHFFQTSAETLLFLLFFRSSLIKLASKKPLILFPLQNQVKWYFYTKSSKLQLLDNWQIRSQITDFLILLNPAHSCVLWGLFVILAPGKKKKYRSKKDPLQNLWQKHQILDPIKNKHISFNRINSPEEVAGLANLDTTNVMKDFYLNQHRAEQIKRIQKMTARLKISETYEPKHKEGVASWFSYIRKHYLTIWRPFLRAFGTKIERRKFNKEKKLLKKTMRRRDRINEKASIVFKQPEQYTEAEIQQFSQLNSKLISEMSPEAVERAKIALKTKNERRREAQKINLQKIKLEYEKRKARREWVYSYFKQKNEDDIKTNSSMSMKNLTAQRMAWYKEIDQTKPYIYKRRITPLLSNNVRDTIHPDLETVTNWKAFYKVYWPNSDIDGATTHTQFGKNPWPVNSDRGLSTGKDIRPRNTPIHHMIAQNRAGFSKGNSLYQIFNQYFGILENSWNLVIQPRLNIDAYQYRVFDLFAQRVESVVENFRLAYELTSPDGRNERMQQLVNDYQWLLKIAYNRRYKTPGTDKELELFFEYLNSLSVNKLIYGITESRARLKEYLEFLEEYEQRYGWTIEKPPSYGWRRRGVSDTEYAESKVFWQMIKDFKQFRDIYKVRISHYVLNHIRIRDSWDRVCKGHRDINLGALHIMFTMNWDLIPARYEQAIVMAQHKRTMTPYSRRVFNSSVPDERLRMMNTMPNFFYKFREENVANLRANLLLSQFRTLHRLLRDSPEYFPLEFPGTMHNDSRIGVPVFEVADVSQGVGTSFDQMAKTFALNPIMDDNVGVTIEEEDRVLGCVNYTMPNRMARHRFSSLWLVTEKHDPYHESMWSTMGQNFMYILYTPFWKILEEFYANVEEYVGALSIEYYEEGLELTDELLDEIRDEATQMCSDDMDVKIPITGMYGPRGVCDFREMSRYELANVPYVHCTEILGSDLIGLPTSQICAQNNFLQTTAFMQRFIDVDIPWLFVMESQASFMLPVLAIPTAAAVTYLTNRQALAAKIDYSPLPSHLKIETLNSPTMVTTKHDTLHTFFGWHLKPKIIEHYKPATTDNIFYDWNGQGWWIPKYQQITPTDNPNGLIVGAILLIGMLAVGYIWAKQEPTYVQTHKDLLKNMRQHRYDTKKYIYYLKHKRNHDFYNAIPDNGPWYTEYSIKLWYTRFLDGLAWCSKTIEHVFTSIGTALASASTNAEMLLMSWYTIMFFFFYKLYSNLFIKRYAHELRLTENWEIRALLTRKTQPYIANTIRTLIGIFMQSLVFLPKILWFAVSRLITKIFFFIDYSTKGVYLFVLTIGATLSWYYFLEFMNNPINNSTFEHTTWYYEINSDGTWQNWTRTPQHLEFYNEALRKDSLNAKYQLWFSYLWEPMYGRYGEGQNNMLYADGQIRSGRRKSHHGKRYFDRWADFRWYLHDYDATQKYYPWETKKWRKKWHMPEKIENFNKIKLKKLTKKNQWFYSYYAQNTEYDQWNNMWFTYKRRTYGRSLVEDPASIISNLILDNYLMDAGALTLIIFVPIVVIYNYTEYIQAFGSKPEGLDVYDRSWPKKPTPAPATKFELTTISTYLTEGFETVNAIRNHFYITKMDELLKNTTIMFVDEKTFNLILKKSKNAWDHANYETLKIIETPIITQDDQRKFPKELETDITSFIWNGERDALWTQIIKERDIYYTKTTRIREIEWEKIKKEIQNDAEANHYQWWLKNYVLLLAWLEYNITFAMPYYYSATERFAYLFPDKEKDQEKW